MCYNENKYRLGSDKMKIYTKKGDKGYTTNILGEPIKKSSELIELQGNVDEVNASIGYLRSLIVSDNNKLDLTLRDIQYALFRIGVNITNDFKKTDIREEEVELLEAEIDKMTKSFGLQKNFIYYSGHQSATFAQLVRAIVRRAERSYVRAYTSEGNYPTDLQYLNRLADYIYALARYLNYMSGIQDETMVIR